MIKTIALVGQALHSKFHWVPPSEDIFLVMDNTGGHGSNDAIIQYTNSLKEYNVKII